MPARRPLPLEKQNTMRTFFAPSRLAALALALAALVLPVRASAVTARQELMDAIQDFESGRYAKAAKAFYAVAEDGGDPEMSFSAEYYLAQTLGKLGLWQSALYYDQLIIVEQGPNHPYYLRAVEHTLEVMDAVGDKSFIPDMLDKIYNSDAFVKLPPAVIHRINFIVALWSYSQRKYEDASEFLNEVPKTSPHYARALYLKGLDASRRAASERGDQLAAYDAAANLFKEALALRNDDKVTYSDLADLKELSQLGLARVRYAQGGHLMTKGDGDTGGRFGVAFDEYNKVPRFSRLWRDALFEGAYAAFMNEEPGKALGLLQTLHAPVAGDQLVPESWLLRSHVYYKLCLWEESKFALQKLQDTYAPIREQVDALLGLKREPEFYFALLQNGTAGDSEMPAMVRNELLVDETLRARRSYIVALTREADRLRNIDEFKRTDLLKVLLDEVEAQRNRSLQVAGKTVQRKMIELKDVLENLDGQVEIVRFEMAKVEKDHLERGFEAESKLGKQPLYRPGMPPKGIEYWDFEGEFWPDELGFYRYTIKNACPDEEQASR